MNKLEKYLKYSDGPHAFKFYFDSHAGFDVTRGNIQSKKANSEPVQNRKKSKRKNVLLVRSAD